jgi:two-component system, NtrC family, response regulator AtoC
VPGAGSGAKVLVAGEDPATAEQLAALLEQAGLEVGCLPATDRLIDYLEDNPVDCLLLGLGTAPPEDLELLDRLVRGWPELPVVIVTPEATVRRAVEAMQRGAADFLTPPFEPEEIRYVVAKALKGSELARQNVPESRTAEPAARLLLGDTPAIREVHSTISRVASTLATVLIRGESGTGKELVARAIHESGKRAGGPFVKVNCAALPDNLLESELFGYEKGAFTGAAARKPGRVELAEAGTLFLDEIGDITPAMQVKLLRLLQDREYDPLGTTRTRRADVRFVAATNKNLERMVKTGELREDLFYRLVVVPIWLPPLRDRPDDIERLALYFCAKASEANGRPGLRLTAPALAALRGHRWRGNVRELENLIERLVVLSDGPLLDASDVERELRRQPAISTFSQPAATAGAGDTGASLDERLRKAEREALAHALQRAGNNRTVAARLLGISRRGLYGKLHEHGLL